MSLGSVALVTSNLSAGGAQGVCVTVANALASRGYQVSLVCLNLNDSFRLDEVSGNVDVIDLRSMRSRWAIWPLLRFLRTASPEVVVSFSLPLFMYSAFLRMISLWSGGLAVRSINTPSAVLQHRTGFARHSVIEPLARRFYCQADAVIAQTDVMATDLRRRYGLLPEKVHTIYNPVSSRISEKATQFNVQPPERPLSARYLLFAGRLDYQKNLEGLLQAFELFHRSVPDTVLVLAGAGPYEDRLREKAVATGLAEHVQFVGYQADLAPWYWHAEATVLASHYEGLPNVLIESIALGTPVVAFDSPGGTGDVVLPGENGFLVPYPDVEAFADALVQLVETRPFEREQAMAAAQRFDRERIVDQYEQVLRS